ADAKLGRDDRGRPRPEPTARRTVDIALSRSRDRHDRAGLQPLRRCTARRNRPACEPQSGDRGNSRARASMTVAERTASSAGRLTFENLRQREFPWAVREDTIFVNAASTGPLPERCIEAVVGWKRLRA